MRQLQPLIDPILPELVELRHELHRHPELAYEEIETAARIVAQLQGLPDMELRTGVAGTGVVATLGRQRRGPCVALRADMDALPIQEQGEHAHRSTMPGKMHACGHDGHVTCLVGAARVLAQLGDELAGPVKLLFQPAEEGGAGGKKMCDEGVLDDPPVQAIFGLHGWPDLTQGEIGVRTGGSLASADRLRITVSGVGAHAAYPHQGVDTVLVAAHIIVARQSIASRNTDPLDSVVVTVSQINGGTADNIIPTEVELSGTVPLDIPPVMGAADFAFYAQRVPASFFALGIRPPGRDSYPVLHQPDFDFHDDSIALGVTMHVELVRRFWRDGPHAE